MRRGSWIVGLPVIAALALPAGGCGGDEDPAPAKGKKGASAEGGSKRRQEIEKSVATISNALTRAPLDVESTKAICDKYAREATEAGFADLAQKCEGIKKEAQEAFERAAEKETKDACDTARKYALDGDTKKARNRLNVPKSVQKEDRYWNQILAALADVQKAERADTYFTRVTQARLGMFKGREEWEKAQGVLEAFLAIPAFKASPKAKAVETALAEVKPQAEKMRSARATEQKIRWIPAFNGSNDDLFKWDLGDHESCKVGGDKILTFTSNAEDRETLAMMFGADDWEDYVIDVSFRLDKGPAYVNAHGTLKQEGEGVAERQWQPGAKLAGDDFKKDMWSKVRVEVHGTELKWSASGVAGSTKKLTFTKGPFEIRLPKGSQISIKTVWVKVLKPANASAPSNK